MGKPLGGKTIASRLKSGDTLLDILHIYERHNEKLATRDIQDKWFHEKLTRGNAVHNLRKAGADQGMFLVRESINIPGSFVLSLIHNRDTQHFQISTSPHSGCFSIDNGPQFVGLDQLIAFYRSGANGLPTALSTACPGFALRPGLRKFGENTILHQAVEESIDILLFRKILQHSKCPDINVRNLNGRTALHEACARGQNEYVRELFNNGAEIKTRDSDGNSALHLACRYNQPETCKVLLKQCYAKPQDRCCGSGWVPLHEACDCGNHFCVETLLQNGAACHPRFKGPSEASNESGSEDHLGLYYFFDNGNLMVKERTKQFSTSSRCVTGETPLDFARKRNHRKCIQIIDRYQPPKPRLPSANWLLLKPVDRYKAVELLELAGLGDGCFLVRISKRNLGQHVLTMSYDKTVYNYEIKNSTLKGSKWYYIDDGPYFSSLEYLIDYYCHCSDGLPAELTTPVPASTGRDLPAPPTPRPPVPPPTPSNPTSPQPLPSTSPFPPIPAPHQGLKEIDPKNVMMGRELGQGEFGSVLMGVWTNPEGKKVPVALKTLHGEHINTGETEFRREAEVMMGLDHLCIVKLYGICRGETLMMVQELVGMGSALDYILDYPTAVSLQDFKLWGAQIASGMNYLEGKGFVHRDLALRNILLASKQLVKISDFGLSRAVGAGSNYYKASAGGRWPVKWYAPESINYGTFSSSSDVWSYGVTLWEIFSKGDQPYGNMTGAQDFNFIPENILRNARSVIGVKHPPISVIQYIDDDKRRLQKPAGCPDKVYSIMNQCWAFDPKDRPTFLRLHQKFRNDPEYFNMQVPGHH